MQRVGLGYIKIGQQATTLSGGEAQRIKLSKELSRRATGRTVYILDEPTTGLHFEDIRRLMAVLQELVESGNTVIVIEHNLDVVKTADWIIDIGPEGGDGGGQVVAVGTPEDIIKNEASITGAYLKTLMERQAERGRDKRQESGFDRVMINVLFILLVAVLPGLKRHGSWQNSRFLSFFMKCAPNRELMFIKQIIWQNWSVPILSGQMIIRLMRLGSCIRKCGN